MKYEFLPHTSEVKFRAYGKTLNNAFENMTLAFAKIIARENNIKSKKTKEIKIKGTDKKGLLYNFLDELIYLFDAKNFITKKAKVLIKGNNLKAELEGDDSRNYKGLDHVKAITYAEMLVSKKKEEWVLQTVVDV